MISAPLDSVSAEGLSLHCVEAYLAPRGSIYNAEYIVCSHFAFMPPSPWLDRNV